MYVPSGNSLYDEVHAIMVKELLTFFKAISRDFEAEVPYNYYGNRGSVDIVWYGRMQILNRPVKYLRMFELESRIVRLEELLRKLKDRMEFFPKYFQEVRGLKKVEVIDLHLVLLDTQENWKIVDEYLVSFKSAFGQVNKIFPKDILSKTNDPWDDEFFAVMKNVHVSFFDPLEVRMMEINEDFMVEEGKPFSRLAAFQMWSPSWWNCVDKLRSELAGVRPAFLSAADFLKAYKKYISS